MELDDPGMQDGSLFLKEEESFWRAPMKGARFALLAVIALAVGFLLFATKPWTVLAAAAELRAAGEEPQLEHDIALGLWLAALGVVIAGLFLVATWKRWCAPLRASPRPAPIPSESLAAPAFWLLVCSAVALGGIARWNLATRGLWWDELWAVKHASLGYLKPKGEPEKEDFKFIKRDWATTIWGYRKPTNHPQASISSRVSQSIWRAQTGAEAHAFEALAVRAPSFIAGLVSICAIAVLVRRWGFAIGGIAAAFFLALHPWHMRYGTEERGYSFAVLWTILGCLWLAKALSDEQGQWRYWLLFGLNQLLITWCLPNSFYYAIGFTAVAAICVWLRWNPGNGRAVAVWRLLVVNTLAAMTFFPLFLPNFLQAMRWGEINDHALLTGGRLLNALCQLGFGMNINAGPGVENEGIPSLSAQFDSSPWGAWPTMILLIIGVIVGLVRLTVARRHATLILLSVVAAAALSLLVTKIGGHFFYHRYIIYLIVPVTALFGIGLAGFSRAITARGAPAAFVGIAVLGLYFYSTRDARALLISRPYAPFEEVAEHLQSRIAKHPELRTIGYGLGGRMLGMYHPRTRFAKNKADLKREIVEATAAAAPYVIVLGYEGVNRENPEYSDGFDIIDQPGAFVASRHFAGIDPLFYFKILEPVPEIKLPPASE